MLLAVVLVLIGSATHATWNLLASTISGEDPRLIVAVYSAFSIVLLIPASGVVLARGATMSWALVGASLVSAVAHAAYALCLQAAYGRSDVNVTYPVARGLGPVLVALVAVSFLGEHLSWPGWLGIALITSGVAVVSTGVLTAQSDRVRRTAGVRWGLLVAGTIACYTLWDAYSVTRLDMDPVLYYTGTGVGMLGLLGVLVARKLPAIVAVARQHWRIALLIGLLTPLSYVLVLIALTMAPVSVVAPLRSTSIVLGSLGAWIWLGEQDGRRRLLGAVVVSLGVAAMVLG